MKDKKPDFYVTCPMCITLIPVAFPEESQKVSTINKCEYCYDGLITDGSGTVFQCPRCTTTELIASAPTLLSENQLLREQVKKLREALEQVKFMEHESGVRDEWTDAECFSKCKDIAEAALSAVPDNTDEK